MHNKSYLIGVATFMAALVGLGIAAQSFTTLNQSAYWGKTGIPALTSAIDGNFAQVNTEAVSVKTATTNVLTSADYGKHVMITTNAASVITLPANGAPAGTVITFSIVGSDANDPVISAATADTLVGPNDIDLKSVTWATGHRINATAKFWSDGSFWHVQNLGGTTMTYTD